MSISALDGFIYVTDEKQGLFVIKTFDDVNKPFDAPRKLDFGNELKQYRVITVFKTSAAWFNRFVSVVFTFSMIVAAFMF